MLVIPKVYHYQKSIILSITLDNSRINVHSVTRHSSLFSCISYKQEHKHSTKCVDDARICKAEFKKQVFPRLSSPRDMQFFTCKTKSLYDIKTKLLLQYFEQGEPSEWPRHYNTKINNNYIAPSYSILKIDSIIKQTNDHDNFSKRATRMNPNDCAALELNCTACKSHPTRSM